MNDNPASRLVWKTLLAFDFRVAAQMSWAWRISTGSG